MPATPEKHVSSIPARPVSISSVPYAAVPYSSVPYVSLPYVSAVNATASAKPSYASYASSASVNVKPAVTSNHNEGTGTPASAASYAKFTGAGGKESVSVVALLGALFVAIAL